MLPVYDLNPTRRTPVVTLALIVINVGVFVISPLAWPLFGDLSLADEINRHAYVCSFGAIPEEITSLGESSPRCSVLPGAEQYPVWLTVLTAMFVHGGWAHLLGNMLFLWVFGNNVEDRLGRLRYLVFYLACGALATIAFAAANPSSEVPLVGASGAIAGVLGAYLVWYPWKLVISLVGVIPLPLPSFLVLGLWFVLQWMYASGSGVTEEATVAYLAHVVGFVAGFAYAATLGRRFKPPKRPKKQAPPQSGPGGNGYAGGPR